MPYILLLTRWPPYPERQILRVHAWIYAILLAASQFIYQYHAVPASLRIYQIIFCVFVPALIVFIIAYRNVTFEQAFAHRFVLNTAEFRHFIRYDP